MGPLGTPTVTILVVDDDRDVRDSLRLALEFEGYDVRTAANGRDALDFLEEGPVPSLVLLDLMMPVMNGQDFLVAIRADPRFAGLPVVVVTAFSRTAQELRSRGLEAQGFVEKPIDIEVLLSAIRRSFGRKAAEHEERGHPD